MQQIALAFHSFCNQCPGHQHGPTDKIPFRHSLMHTIIDATVADRHAVYKKTHFYKVSSVEVVEHVDKHLCILPKPKVNSKHRG